MAIGDDFSIATEANGGDIRRTGTAAANHTVLALHQWIGGLMDDAQASGDDLADITTSTIDERSTNQIITLNSPYNIDDTAARHLFAGSILQNDGDDLYATLRVLGPVEANTEVMVIQDDKVLAAWWGTGVNANAAANIVTEMMIKVREGGADIDGKRVLVMVREFGDQYKEFSVTMGEGISVAAVGNLTDLNNTTAAATVRGWTTIGNTEGFQLIDIDNDTVNEEYYAQFDRGSQSLNDVYEWSKLQSARSLEVLSGADTGTNYIIDDGTTVGQAQSFTTHAVAEKLTEARFRIKINAGTPTGPLTAELYASTAGVIPTGAALATSEEVLASLITTAYQEVIFRFNDNVTMSASTQYCIVIRHPNGDGSNNFHVEGAASGTVGGENKANENPAATWNAEASADLWFSVKGSPIWHGRPGENFRGITHEIVYDTESGNFTEDEVLFWGSQITYDNIASGPFVVGDYVTFEPVGGGAVKVGGKILKQTATILTVALDDITGGIVADNDIIRVVGKATTADVNATIVDDDKGGGEGILLALDDNGADGDFYIQLIHGVAPVNNLQIEGRTSTETALVNTTVTARPVSPEFIGQTTGTNLIGAYGIGFETTDVGNLDKFTALDNVLRSPPNNVTFTVTGLVSGDRVLVGPRTGTSLEKAQLTTDTTLSAATETLIQCDSAIPTDTPSSGTGTDNTRVRVLLDSGIYRRVQYDSYSGNDFTITTGPDDDWTGANVSTAPKDVFVAYIDVAADATEEAYTAVYKGTDQNLFVRVRDGGGTPIKTFEGDAAVFGSSDSSQPAIRTPDA